MPTIPTRPAASPHFKLVFGEAAGLREDDFHVLGYCRELDEQEIARNPAHQDFTHLVRFAAGHRAVLAKVTQRLESLWASPCGVVLGVGQPKGVIEIRGNQLSQLAIPDVPGTFAKIWGTGDEHVFACGNYRPFWLYRERGAWRDLPLPADTPGLWCVRGTRETDVYAAGQDGAILHFDGQTVRRLDSPTTRWLTCMAELPGGRICIGGHDGTLLYGNRQGWRHVHTGTHEPLLNIVPWRDGVCFVTPDGVWWFDGIQALPQLLVRQGGRWLNAVGARLMIVNSEEAWLFDGQQLQPLDTTL